MICVWSCVFEFSELVVCLGDDVVVFFFFQAEDGIRDLVRSRGLGDVYKRQALSRPRLADVGAALDRQRRPRGAGGAHRAGGAALSLIHI